MFNDLFDQSRRLRTLPIQNVDYDANPRLAGLAGDLIACVAKSGVSVAEAEMVINDLPHLLRCHSFAHSPEHIGKEQQR